MNRATVRQKKIRPGSPAEIAEQAGYGPEITLEGPYLTLRWKQEQVAEALDSAGMTLEQILTTHLAARLDATNMVHIKHRAGMMVTFTRPDLRTRFRMLKLALELRFGLPGQYSGSPVPSRK